MCDPCKPSCVRNRSYDVTSNTTQGNFGLARRDTSVKSRLIYNSAGQDIYVGFSQPNTSTGRWPGAFLIASGDYSPIFESGEDMWIRPSASADTIQVCVIEEYC